MAKSIKRKVGRPSNRPISDEELMSLYNTLSASQIGRAYGVSEGTVRSWVYHIKHKQDAPAVMKVGE